MTGRGIRRPKNATMAPFVLKDLNLMLLAAGALLVVFVLHVHAVSPGLTTLVGTLSIAFSSDEATLVHL